MTHIVKLPGLLLISAGSSYVACLPFDELMEALPDESVDAIYADPPFGTGVTRVDPRDPSTLYRDDLEGERWLSMLRAFAAQARRVLKPSGSVYLHLDWRGVHEAKLLAMDEVFGRDNQIGEIIWSFDWGCRQKDRFARKHDTILHYAKESGAHRFDVGRVDRVPYKAPELQMYRAKRLGKNDGAARIAAGKPVTDVFQDINIVGTSSNERKLNSYPTMKPTRLVRRLLSPVVTAGSVVLDPFCGSGASLEAAHALSCSFVMGDASEKAARAARIRADRLEAKYFAVER
jgi:site-specific DNA-methyltransferase (adenine-specific)